MAPNPSQAASAVGEPMNGGIEALANADGCSTGGEGAMIRDLDCFGALEADSAQHCGSQIVRADHVGVKRNRRGRPPKSDVPNDGRGERRAGRARLSKAGKRLGRPPKNRGLEIIPLANTKPTGRPPKNRGRKARARPTKINKQRGLSERELVQTLDSLIRVASRIKMGMKPGGRPRKNRLKRPRREDVLPIVVAAPSVECAKRQRGRPRKNENLSEITTDDSQKATAVKHSDSSDSGRSNAERIKMGMKPRGRPPKTRMRRPKREEVLPIVVAAPSAECAKRRRGRPRKNKNLSENTAADSQKAIMVKRSDSSDSGRSNAERLREHEESEADVPSSDLLDEDSSSVRETLLQLCAIAKDPMKEFSCASVVISFFTKMRSLLSSSDDSEVRDLFKSVARKRGRKRKALASSELEYSAEVEPEDWMQDSHWSGGRVENNAGEQPASRGRKRKGDSMNGKQNKKAKTLDEPLPLPSPLDPSPDSAELILKEETPTALILAFLIEESIALPSVADLIGIFSQFGPLNEEEIEILRNTSRAKVVFRYREDAEKAFYNAGKYSVFGEAVVSYRLRYLFPPKDSLAASPQNNTDAQPNNNGN